MGTSPEAIGITATLFLPVLSVAARSVFLQPYSERSSDVWLKYCQANHVLRLLVVLLWCAFWEFRPFNNLPPSPFWVAPIIAVFVAQTSVRIISRRILERRWSSSDIARLAFWSTVSPSIALLMPRADSILCSIENLWAFCGSRWPGRRLLLECCASSLLKA